MKFAIFLCLILSTFKYTLQCGCPAVYTQQLVCYSDIVMKARIEDQDEHIGEFNISIDTIYKGEDVLDSLSNNRILTTPMESSKCGPITLDTGKIYIMTANSFDGAPMNINFCDLVAEENEISLTLMRGLSGGYFSNCDCKIPYMWDDDTRRGRLRCGRATRGCSTNAICSKNTRGRCKWQSCR
ncbi:metalloproteinase inhibitor 2-like [Mytilus californianus]|uniref:metalloproteinase inhibitor 2-like n=1 Tax=Mytilus californianus TaxID=6549 RepID=UPI002246A124|nr:metalloproteinase inhibitor 2-like [Mytilus californianus]